MMLFSVWKLSLIRHNKASANLGKITLKSGEFLTGVPLPLQNNGYAGLIHLLPSIVALSSPGSGCRTTDSGRLLRTTKDDVHLLRYRASFPDRDE